MCSLISKTLKVCVCVFTMLYNCCLCTSFDIVTKAAKWHGPGDTICQWVGSVLGGRKITAMFAGENLEESVARGCLQGDVLLPLLWSLVVDKLIGGLNEIGCYPLDA